MTAISTDRIATLDIIRGVAVMGILAANIVGFALPEGAYFSPAALGPPTRADLIAWALTFVLVEGKMRGLFSLLFGASMLLVIDRAAAAGDNPARVHFSRMGWLFVFGLVHLYALWWGDILTHYALAGAVAYGFVRMPVRWMLGLAMAAFALQSLIYARIGLDMVALQAAAHAPRAPAEAIAAWQGLAASFGQPSVQDIAAEVAASRGSFADMIAWRWATDTNPVTTLPLIGAETLGYMLLGMAGLRSGFLNGAWPRAHYVAVAAVTIAITLPLSVALAAVEIAHGFDPRWVFFASLGAATPLRPLMVVGYAALVILLARRGGALAARVATAGRMAFTNYLATTLVCTTLFYGYGFGLFDRLPRAGLYPIVLAIWAAMLVVSKPWLDRYRYGPLEWLWRSLARLAWQPMKRRGDATN